MSFKRPTLFFVAVISLTIILAVLMVILFYPRFSGSKGAVSISVTEESYRQNLQTVLDPFFVDYQNQADALAQKAFVEQTLDQLLDLRVPATYRDVHLEITFTLNHLREALLFDPVGAEQYWRELQDIRERYAWLSL